MKLIQALKCLPEKEYSAFHCYLQNPVVNKRQDILLFFDQLKARKFLATDKQDIFSKIYKDAPFESTKWRLLCSRMLKLLEQYFAFSEFQNQKTKQQIELGSFYINQKRERQFTSTFKDAEKQLEKATNKTEKHWLEKYNWNEMNYYFIESQNRQKRTSLDEMSEQLDVFYFISKLKISLRELSRAVINAETYSIQMLQEVLANIDKNPRWLQIPAIKVYHQCYVAIRESGTEKDFQELRKSIHKHQSIFTERELRDIYFIAINYCIRKLNTGNDKYNREALELYRLSLEAGLLLKDGFLPEPAYNNIVTLSIKENEFDWAQHFVDSYKNSLKASSRNSMYQFCSAKILFSQDQYDECLIILASIPNKLPFIYLGAKTMQIKIFIENKEYDLLDSLLESLRVYLQRRKDLGYRKQNYVNLVKFAKKLIQLPIRSNSEKEAFIEEIKAAEIFTEKTWFLERIE